MTDKSRTPAGHPEGRAATKSGAFAAMGKWSAQAERPRPLIRSVEESLALAAARAQRPAPAEEAPAAPASEPSSPRPQADAPKSKSFSEQVAAVLAGILAQPDKDGSKEAQKDAPEAAAPATASAPQPVPQPTASAAPKAPIHSGAVPRKVAPPPPPPPPYAGASPASRIPASRADEPLPLAMRPVSASNKLHTREFVFTIEDYENIRRRIYDFAGIALASSKQDMVYGRLVKRLRERRLSSFREYLELIDRDGAEWEVFVNALTTNLTSFFREAHHFELLAHRLRLWQPPASRPFRIWCCAASTGEEPYSLAMTACEAFGTLRPPVEIVASDINTQVLIDAREGVYSSERMTGVSEGRLQKFFQPMDGEHSSRWKVIPELQHLIRFCRINLLDANWPLHGRFDAIFCRNVMIYFDRETQRTILQRFLGVLEEDGELYAGHSESFLHAADLFTSAGKTVYRVTRKKK